MATQAQAQSLSIPRSRSKRLVWLLSLIGLLIIVFIVSAALPSLTRQFPREWDVRLSETIDEFQSWVINNRNTHPIFVYFFDPISSFIDTGVRAIEDALLSIPWFVLVFAFGLLGSWLSGVRLALLCVICLLLCGLFGLWEQSMQTLALMLFSVVIALLIGVPLGIIAAYNDRFDRFLRPILDGMQTMPAFVYLIPVVLFFGVARVPAVVATVIYAIPPAIRLTNLGIREVQPSAVEAARAFGSTRWQMLWKVQFPLALPSVMAGVNQTIMMALGIVVIAAMVGAGGLGREVYVSLQRLQVGQAFEAGLVIVVLAIMLDRLSESPSKIDAAVAPIANAKRVPWWLFVGAIALSIVIGLLLSPGSTGGTFPADWRLSIREPIDAAVAWMRDNLYQIGSLPIGTGPLSDFLTLYVLNPVRDFLRVVLPWPVVIAAVSVIAYRFAGGRLALFSALGLLFIGLLGMWELSMDTLSQILVTMLFTLVLALPIGILASQSNGVHTALRPVLDFLQTIPTFVYLVPVIMLFNIGRIPGIIAAVLYAIPVGIRLTELGIRQVPHEAVEAAHAFGSTRTQTIVKVQLPLARPTIALSINQMIMMVLAMVIIAGLVGSAGLGLEAVTGLARSQVGRGIEAGLAIVILAIIMDRITQAWATRQQ